MDSSGKIHDLSAAQLEAMGSNVGELVVIPQKMIGRVTFLPGHARRAWRELVRAGVDPEVALLQVQSSGG